MTNLHVRIAIQDGVFSSQDAYDCGHDRHTVDALVAAGKVVRVRRGAFVDAGYLADATPERRHALRTWAVVRSFGPEGTVAPSHHSAVAVHDLPLHQVDQDHIHLSRTRAGGTRVTAGVTIHRHLPDEAYVRDRGRVVVRPGVAVLQAAAVHGLATGVVAAEAGLNRRLFTRGDLDQALELSRLGRGRPWARATVAVADGHSESPGESLTRLLLASAGLPTPEQQVDVYDDAGLVGRVDFLFRAAGVIVEFDGAVKYDGAEGRRALVREKRREDRLRALGYEVVRLTWADLQHPLEVHRRFLAAARRAART